MGEEVKAKVAGALTPRALIISIVMVLIGIVINLLCWTGAGVTMEPWWAGRLGVPIYPPYGLAFVLALVVAFSGAKYLSKQEAALIVASLFITLDAPYIIQAFEEPFIASSAPYTLEKYKFLKDLWQFYPPLWTPSNMGNLLAGAYSGGSAVPWGALAPYIAFWCFVLTVFLMCQLFLGAIAKYFLVDEERLPFPNVIPVSTLLGMSEEKSKFLEYVKKPVFVIPFAIGFIVGMMCSANYWAPFFPVFYAWGQIHIGALDKFFKSINPSISGWYIFVPADLAICYLMPLDVLITGLVWVILAGIVWPIVATSTGMVAPGSSVMWGGPFPVAEFSLYGVPIGLALWLLIFRRDVFSKILRGGSGEGDIPPKLLLGGFTVFTLLYILIWLYVGAPIILVLVFIVIFYLMTFGQAKYVGETGYWPGFRNEYFTRYALWQAGAGLGIFTSNPMKSKAAWATMAMGCVGTGHTAPQAPCYAWGIASSFKIGADAGVKPKELFMGLIVSTLIVGILGIPISLSLYYSLGLNAKLTHVWWLRSASHIRYHQSMFVLKAGSPLGTSDWVAIVTGIIVPGIIMFLRARFPWFIVNPAALIFYDLGIWLIPLLIALVLKLITVKVLGARFYERVGVPIAVAYLAGTALAATIGGVAFTIYKVFLA